MNTEDRIREVVFAIAIGVLLGLGFAVAWVMKR